MVSKQEAMDAINARIAEDKGKRSSRQSSRRKSTAEERDAINAKIVASKAAKPDADPLHLPAGWEFATNEDGREYFYHRSSGNVTWTKPPSDAGENAPPMASVDSEAPLLPGWEPVEAEDGRTYYWNVDSDDITWTRPVASLPPQQTHGDETNAPPVKPPPSTGKPPPTAKPAPIAAKTATPATLATPVPRMVARNADEATAAPSATAPGAAGHALLARAAHAANARGDASAAKRLFLEATTAAPADSVSHHRYKMSAANMCLKLGALREAIIHYEALEAAAQLPDEVGLKLPTKLQLARARLADREATSSPDAAAARRLSGPAAPSPWQHQQHQQYRQYQVEPRAYETLRETTVVSVMQADTWRGRFDPPPGSSYLPPPGSGYLPPPEPPDSWSSFHTPDGGKRPKPMDSPRHATGYARMRDDIDEELGEMHPSMRSISHRRCDGDRVCDLLMTFVVTALLMTIGLGLWGAWGPAAASSGNRNDA